MRFEGEPDTGGKKKEVKQGIKAEVCLLCKAANKATQKLPLQPNATAMLLKG